MNFETRLAIEVILAALIISGLRYCGWFLWTKLMNRSADGLKWYEQIGLGALTAGIFLLILEGFKDYL